jgi:hypothetical protein
MPNISDKGLQELDELRKQLEEMNERNRIPPTKLFCVNCGGLISDHYEGQAYSLTHFCKSKETREKEKFLRELSLSERAQKDNAYWWEIYGQEQKLREATENMCTSLTLESHPLICSSWVMGDFDCRQCKDCHTPEEHAESIIQYYLGKHYKEFTPENPKVAKVKEEIITFIKEKTKIDSVADPKIGEARRKEMDDIIESSVKKWAEKRENTG